MSADTAYIQWLNDWNLYPRPSDLPDTPNANGRPVWEPPILEYTTLIGEHYEKKRDAVLKFTNGDVGRTTTIMDLYTEETLLFDYLTWAKDSASAVNDKECKRFFEGLGNVLRNDWFEVEDEWIGEGGVGFMMRGDGTYEVTTFPNPDGADTGTESDATSMGEGSSDALLVLTAKDAQAAMGTREEDVKAGSNYTSMLKDAEHQLASLSSLGITAAVSSLSTLPFRLPRPNVDPSLAIRLLSLHASGSSILETQYPSSEHCLDELD